MKDVWLEATYEPIVTFKMGLSFSFQSCFVIIYLVLIFHAVIKSFSLKKAEINAGTVASLRQRSGNPCCCVGERNK